MEPFGLARRPAPSTITGAVSRNARRNGSEAGQMGDRRLVSPEFPLAPGQISQSDFFAN